MKSEMVDAKGNEVKIGQKAKDLITGFSGVVVSLTEYLHQGPRADIQADKVLDNGEIGKSYSFDLSQLEIVEKKQVLSPKFGKSKVQIGMKVRDTTNGYEGFANGKSYQLNGCIIFQVSRKATIGAQKDVDYEWISEHKLEIIEEPKEKEAKPIKTGGPAPSLFNQQVDSKKNIRGPIGSY